jgi:hypothetical protein
MRRRLWALSRSRETAILGAAALRGLGEEQFSRGVVIERHARSQSRYSYLNSFNVIARSAAASRTPRCVSSMIFRATRRVAGSSTTFRLEVSHTLFRTSDMLSMVSGSNAWPDRNGRIGMTHPHSGVGVGDRTQVWRHGYTGFLLATYGNRRRNISAVRASRSCAPSGPPANAPGPR